jgi:hypothetical protein
MILERFGYDRHGEVRELAKRTAATWRVERPHGTGAGGDGRYRRQPSRTVYWAETGRPELMRTTS